MDQTNVTEQPRNNPMCKLVIQLGLWTNRKKSDQIIKSVNDAGKISYTFQTRKKQPPQTIKKEYSRYIQKFSMRDKTCIGICWGVDL